MGGNDREKMAAYLVRPCGPGVRRVLARARRRAHPDARELGHGEHHEHGRIRSSTEAGWASLWTNERPRGAGLDHRALVQSDWRTVQDRVQSAAVESLQRIRHAACGLRAAAAVFSIGCAGFI